MPAAVLDTNVLFASASARDEYHETGREIVRGVDHGELPVCAVPNYVIAEILNLANEKLGPDAANALLDRLIEGANFEVTHATRADFTTAQGLFRRDEHLSFVDAVVAAYMARAEIPYLYSFDGGFDSIEHVSRLDTPVDPFD